jgi:hypothetical protein
MEMAPMTAAIRSVLGAVAGGVVFGLVALSAGAALAGGGGGSGGGGGGDNCGCGSTPTPTPPSKPPHHPQPWGPGTDPGTPLNVNVNVNIANAVAVSGASAQASAFGSGSASSVVYGGGGGGGASMGPGAPGFVQNLNIYGGGDARRSAYDATRTRVIKVVIQASCMDDRDVPHPASQVTPDRDIEDGYDGEVYRCIAGTRMQYVQAEYTGQIAFDHGQTISCLKGQALYHSRGGHLECRAQLPARDCNERSLLRRFGAGVKIMTIVSVEHYTAYHEEQVQTQTAGSFSLDGGVGGMVY